MVAVGKGERGFGVVKKGIAGKNFIIGKNANAAGAVTGGCDKGKFCFFHSNFFSIFDDTGRYFNFEW